jgi:hypothetical protein
MCVSCEDTARGEVPESKTATEIARDIVEAIQCQPLVSACKLIAGDRNKSYGNPEDDFRHTAKMWTAYLGFKIEPYQVPMMMVMLKMSRESHCHKEDNYVDAAGYIGCAYRTRIADGAEEDNGS